MNYKYSNINPSENKQLYMYSEYHGAEFIKAYKQSRKEVLNVCLKKTENIYDKKDKVFLKFQSLAIDKCEYEDIIFLFIKLLKNKLNLLKQNILKLDNIIMSDINLIFYSVIENKIFDKQKIDSLVKKLEVKKSFTKEFEEFSNEVDEIYHLAFSFIVIEYFRSVKSFKYLSVLLKLNDFLVYRLNNQKFSNIDLLACSISLELSIFNKTEKDLLEN